MHEHSTEERQESGPGPGAGLGPGPGAGAGAGAGAGGAPGRPPEAGQDLAPEAARQPIAEELERWHGRTVAEWRERWGVPALRVFRRVGSTSDVAREMAEAGATAGTLVLADEQTRGRGRRGRRWESPSGSSLSMSMVLRPPHALAGRMLTLRLGLAAARVLDELLVPPDGPAADREHDRQGEPAAHVQLKWPNDLIVGGRKVGGILCEGAATERRMLHVVAGIGLNLRTPDDGWSADIAERAGSLAEAGAVAPRPSELAGAIARAWIEAGNAGDQTLSPAERRDFEWRDALRGRRVSVEGRPAGVAHGVTATGNLRVREGDRDGEIQAGTIRIVEGVQGDRT